MANLQPQSTRQFLVNIEGIEAYFQKASGFKATRNEQEYNDGQTGQVKTHLDFLKYEKITLSKTFDADKDNALLEWAENQFKKGEPFSVTLQPVKADLGGSPVPGARTMIASECQLSAYQYPDVDRDSGGLAQLVLEIIPGVLTVQ